MSSAHLTARRAQDRTRPPRMESNTSRPTQYPKRRRQAVKTYRIATIPGDGIGKEVIPAGRQVLQALAAAGKSFAFEFENFDWGGDYFRHHGVMMPDNGLDVLRGNDALLCGSPRSTHTP